MNGSENTRWVAVSALGAAMFAIGFSFAGVACNSTRDVSVTEAARAADSAIVVPAPAASFGKVAGVVNGGAGSPPVTPSPAITAVLPDPKLAANDAGLKLKRVVVTHKIENHEPTAGADFSLGNEPVYAFVELDNSSGAARVIDVMFENEDTKATVGHVKLTVPANQPRYRTWGNTRLIRDPGRWVAVVSTVDGVELGRAPFEVKG
ncbi:MAG: DUF2914 domain-containing protein [Pseudomonadota bacterium]